MKRRIVKSNIIKSLKILALIFTCARLCPCSFLWICWCLLCQSAFLFSRFLFISHSLFRQ